MKMNKAIKRIVALGTGITMVGATILGAMAAADLNVYPKPFVNDGAFNAYIVVGSQAKTEDVLGSIDIATSLQYATRVETPIPGETATATITGEGVKIEGSSQKLTLGRDLDSVKGEIDVEDMPELLADGVYVADGDDEDEDYDYTQELEFNSGANMSEVRWHEGEDDLGHIYLYAPEAGDNTEAFMTYTLEFGSEPKSDIDTGVLVDFEGTKLDIMGMNYEITSAGYSGTTLTVELMGGTGLFDMYEGETQTFTVDGEDYEVTVDIISDTSDPIKCQLTVNGETTKELKIGDTTTVAGITLGVKKLLPNEAGEEDAGKDLIQFYLGADKMVLTDDTATTTGSAVKVGTKNSEVLFHDWSVNDDVLGELELNSLTMYWQPDEDILVEAGDDVTFPLGTFKVSFAGLTAPESAEEIKIVPNGEFIKLEAPVGGDDSFNMNFIWSDAGTFYLAAEDEGEGLIYTDLGLGTITLNKGDYILCSNLAEDESYLVEFVDVTSVDGNDKAVFEDILSNREDSGEDDETSVKIDECEFALGEVIGGSTDTVEIVSGDTITPVMYTKEGLQIDFSSVSVDGVITITEEDDDDGVGAGGVFSVTATWDGDETSVGTVADDPATPAGLAGPYEVDEDVDVWYSTFGTKITEDATDSSAHSVMIDYPGEEVNADVFVNGIDAQVNEAGGSTYGEVQRIDVGAAILDTEAPALGTQNLIVVGGPCVNTVAAALMENPTDCTAGFEDGKAMIKLFENSGKVSMLVAGYSAMDTRRASRVVAGIEPGDYSGVELEVTGTSLSDIKVSAPQ